MSLILEQVLSRKVLECFCIILDTQQRIHSPRYSVVISDLDCILHPDFAWRAERVDSVYIFLYQRRFTKTSPSITKWPSTLHFSLWPAWPAPVTSRQSLQTSHILPPIHAMTAKRYNILVHEQREQPLNSQIDSSETISHQPPQQDRYLRLQLRRHRHLCISICHLLRRRIHDRGRKGPYLQCHKGRDTDHHRLPMHSDQLRLRDPERALHQDNLLD